MIIQSPTPTTTTPRNQSNESYLNRAHSVATQETTMDSVQFSQEARQAAQQTASQTGHQQTGQWAQSSQMAIRSPAALISNEQVQIKMSLVRVLMETLFGEQKDNDSTAREEMVEAVLEEPLAQQTEAMMKMVTKNREI